MYSSVLLLLAFSLYSWQAHAKPSHQGIAGDNKQAESVEGSGNQFGTLQMPAPSGEKVEDLPAKKSGTPIVETIRSRSVSAYLFATGPKLGTKSPNAQAADATRKMIQQVEKRSPLATIIDLPEFHLKLMQQEIEKLVTAGVTLNLTLILNAEAMQERKELTLWTADGELPESKWADLIKGNDRKVDVILLSSFSQRADCNRYPASVFGMTGIDSWRRLARVEEWLAREKFRVMEVFPPDALAWAQSWEASAVRSPAANTEESIYWYCQPRKPNKIIKKEFF